MVTPSFLESLSNEMADVVAAASPSVVQVQGGGRPCSGLVYAADVVLTTVRAIGREDDLHVRRDDGKIVAAELAGWDPATNLAVVRAPGLDRPVMPPSEQPARVGQVGIAVARSWSNFLTASAGIVAVIGGPLPTGRRRAIDEVIRVTAPMHDGFSGGALVNATGQALGVTTAARIRGLGVVIPAAIAWKTAATVLEHGRPRQAYIGVAVRAVSLPPEQRPAPERGAALLVLEVASGSPGARAGVLVGDVIADFDGQPVSAPDDLLDLLTGDRIGRTVPLRILRGGQPIDATIEIGERPSS